MSAAGNTRSRAWFMTWNNFPHDWETQLTQKTKEWRGQHEKGENGNDHIQACFRFEEGKSFTTVKELFNGAHIEPCKNWRSASKYCTKEETRVSNIKIIDKLLPWQEELEKIVLSEPDDRTIHYYYDEIGGKGKTAICKYLLIKYNNIAYTASGKSIDILTLADPKKTVYLIDLPRSNDNHCPYNAIEQLKNGLVSDGKLKKQIRTVIMNPPHIIIFSNHEPDINKLSYDRWKFTKL